MSKIILKGRPYGGSTTVTDALHLLTKDTLNTNISAQNMLTNILGDMAQLETSTAATKAYAKGEYLVLGSYFYKVTATIDPGDTLTVGTNIERTNVGAEMRELDSKADDKIDGSALWGGVVDSISLQLNPPTGNPARLFVRCGSDWYFIDLPYKI